MATQKVKVFMHKYTYSDDLRPYPCRADDEYTLFVGETEIDYEIPADFNPVALQVAALKKQLDTLADKHMQDVQRITSKIAELQCIENSATVTA